MNAFLKQSLRLNMQWERAIQKGCLAIRLVQGWHWEKADWNSLLRKLPSMCHSFLKSAQKEKYSETSTAWSDSQKTHTHTQAVSVLFDQLTLQLDLMPKNVLRTPITKGFKISSQSIHIQVINVMLAQEAAAYLNGFHAACPCVRVEIIDKSIGFVVTGSTWRDPSKANPWL